VRGRRAPGAARDLAVVVIEVASELRAGADPGRAWSRALGRPVGNGGSPDLADLSDAGTPSQAAAVVAAGRLAGTLGAPLAQVLERVADALAAAAEADGERRAALAGPRATARVLTGLPILGAVLGSAVGADPVGVLLGGGVGTFALVVGVALLLAGRWWIARLVHAASRAGAT
jgi:tight adherence protein B